jgi:YDG domain
MNAQIRRFRRGGVMLIALVVALLTVVPAANADLYDPTDWAPTVWSDKADYAPGERVTLNGAHWTPGETVHIRVNDDTGNSWERDVDVTADETGGIVDQFNLPSWFVAQYRVTATGASGAVATTTFTDGNVSFALATADQEAPANLSWSVNWRHYTNFECVGQDGSGTADYRGNTLSSGSQPAVGNKQSAEPSSVTAPGYVLDYWSASATSTTPLTATQLCKNGPDNHTLYAHLKRAIQATALSTQSATGTYGGTTNLSATLTAGGSGVGGKSVTFKLNDTIVGTATTTSSGVASLANASLTGINAGSYASGVSASFAGDTSYSSSNATSSLTVSPRAVTGGFTAADKVYDGTRDAEISGRSLTGVVGGEDVTLTGGTALFDTKDVGVDKDVTGSGFELAGADKGNYSLESATLVAKARITAKQLTGHFTAADKVYDGNRDADITGRSLDGVLGTEDVTLTGGSALFDTKDVGVDKDVTGSGFELGGADNGNYTLGSVADVTADIMPKAITGSFTAADKIYDGNRDAEISGRSLTGVVGSEDVTLAGGSALFDTKDVGVDKDVAGSGFALAGADKGNYALESVADANADITPKAITGSFTAADKVYDGSRDAAISGRSLSGVVEGDEVSLAGGRALFDTKDVGVDTDVAGSGFELAGADSGNYSLQSDTLATKASITAKSITGSFTAADKVYDGTVAATISDRSLVGVVGDDDVTLVGGTATFATADVGQNKTVSGIGFALAGADKGNYSLASSTLTTTASITYRWDGFLQPINDTAHQTGVNESKFKLGQTIPAKFVIKDAFGTVVKQASNPSFSRSGKLGACDANAVPEAVVEEVTPAAGVSYGWDGSKYHYNWSTKGLTFGEYRIYANLADGTKRFVDICLTK